jgi:hypothetical protein
MARVSETANGTVFVMKLLGDFELKAVNGEPSRIRTEAHAAKHVSPSLGRAEKS